MIYFWSSLCIVAALAGVGGIVYACSGGLTAAVTSKRRWLVGAVVALALAYVAGGAWWRNRQVEQCCVALGDMGAAIELYAEGHSAYPAALNDLMPDFMDELPACPCQGGAGWKYESNPDGFTISCQGHNHPGLGGTPENFPCFTAADGIVRGSAF